MKSISGISDRVLLVICDGMGYSDNRDKNAVFDANTPNIDHIFKHYPFTTLKPGGEDVGLPKGVVGNSEVGHLNLGAGRAVRQDLVRINEAIKENTLKDMDQFIKLLEVVKAGNKRLHLLGLLSDGGVHSHIGHTKAILDILKNHTDIEVYLHAFMDGRDTPKSNGKKYLKDILDHGGFTLASLQGRSIGMDRDRRWEKIQNAYDTITGKNGVNSSDPIDYVLSEYDAGRFDEFIEPALFAEDGKIQSDDVVFFTNYRPDRARQITMSLCDESFSHFNNDIRPRHFLCMTPYAPEELPNIPILFDKEKLKGTLGEYLSKNNIKQLRIAETEKYAHVTYFFNGGAETPFPLEERILVNSPKEVKTYDEKPEMSAPLVLENLLKGLDDEEIKVIICNFANPDMVGHTGNYEAAVKAVEYVDYAVGKILKKCDEKNIVAVVTADHGNSDQMVYPDGSPHTSHSASDAPFCVVHESLKDQKFELNGDRFSLRDVSPTLLNIIGLPNAESFEGSTIFK